MFDLRITLTNGYGEAYKGLKERPAVYVDDRDLLSIAEGPNGHAFFWAPMENVISISLWEHDGESNEIGT